MKPLLIQSMYGLGDNMFIRPFVRAQAARRPVYLRTCWPELFEDLGVALVRPAPTKLRTQQRNATAYTKWFDEPPKGIETIKVGYGNLQLTDPRYGGSITKAIERLLPLGDQPYVFDFPERLNRLIGLTQPYAFIRPVTTRREWFNSARNPDPRYVNEIAAALMKTHTVIVVADLKEGEEELVGEMPPHHTAFVKGELSTFSMLSLLVRSDIAVGGVGWLVPAAIAGKVKCFTVLGGQAKHNAPGVITDPRMDLSRIGFAYPNQYCQCNQMRHTCNKQITNLSQQWNAFVSSVTTRGFSLPRLDG